MAVATDIQPAHPCLSPLLLPLLPHEKKIRKTFHERLLPAPGRGSLKDAISIHAASVGEAVIAETFINYARPRIDNAFIVTKTPIMRGTCCGRSSRGR